MKTPLPTRRELKELRAQLERVTGDLGEAKARIALLSFDLDSAHMQRVAAQDGLVPYVRALEAFNSWLVQQPDEVQKAIVPKMMELGIHAIRLGYDPHNDPALQGDHDCRRDHPDNDVYHPVGMFSKVAESKAWAFRRWPETVS